MEQKPVVRSCVFKVHGESSMCLEKLFNLGFKVSKEYGFYRIELFNPNREVIQQFFDIIEGREYSNENENLDEQLDKTCMPSANVDIDSDQEKIKFKNPMQDQTQLHSGRREFIDDHGLDMNGTESITIPKKHDLIDAFVKQNQNEPKELSFDSDEDFGQAKELSCYTPNHKSNNEVAKKRIESYLYEGIDSGCNNDRQEVEEVNHKIETSIRQGKVKNAPNSSFNDKNETKEIKKSTHLSSKYLPRDDEGSRMEKLPKSVTMSSMLNKNDSTQFHFKDERKNSETDYDTHTNTINRSEAYSLQLKDMSEKSGAAHSSVDNYENKLKKETFDPKKTLSEVVKGGEHWSEYCGDKEIKDKSMSIIIFSSKEEFECCLSYLKNSDHKRYLITPEMKENCLRICIQDTEVADELKEIKRNLEKVTIFRNAYEYVRNELVKWKPFFFLKIKDDECMMLTARKDIHKKLKELYPFLYANQSIENYMKRETSQMDFAQTEETKVKPVGFDKNTYKGAINPSPSRKSIFYAKNSVLQVEIFKEDITYLHVDVIVNAANSRLKHGGGVARQIAKYAGRELVEECEKHVESKGKVDVGNHFASVGGNLSVQKVFHAVGPKWSDYSGKPDDCRRLLRQTVLKCLISAEKQGYSSIAFPSISAAIFQVPKEICVESYMRAVQHFEALTHELTVKRLKRILFVDIDDDMVNSIFEHFNQNWYGTEDVAMNLEFIHDSELMKRSKKNIDEDRHARHSSRKRDISPSKHKQSYAGILTSTKPDICSICCEYEEESTFPCCKKMVCKTCFSKCISKCPFCQRIFKTLKGNQPLGNMKILKKSDVNLHGFPRGTGCFEINYFMDEISYQKPYRTAYIPAIKDGKTVLDLLVVAFKRRLIFTKGTSVTTGKNDRITWNDIHHKTSLDKDHPYGYPDASYLSRVKSELEAKGVTLQSFSEVEKSDLKDFWKTFARLEYKTVYCY